MKVLVPVDGSAHSERAVRFAAQLAHDLTRLRIILVNVQPAPSDVDTLHMAQQSILDHLRVRGDDTLAPARKILADAGVAHEAKVELAEDAAVEIARVAREQGCGHIVMGTRGLGALAGLALGSVATKVVHLAEVPVTLVR
ncbi:MAG TPA: universal stress protein [Burkholderiales bacterium]|nr:universal stress protein [Burkholderiales bacterium]